MRMTQDIIHDLSRRFQTGEITRQRDNLVFVSIASQHALPALEWLKVQHGFTHLVLLTATDWIEENQFQLTYLLHNPEEKTDLGLRVFLPRENTVMESAHRLWPAIVTYQRELNEMFGIAFPGSPRVDEPFILEGWEGTPPYRREFDTKRFAATFYHQRGGRQTHDPATYMKEKLYPDE